MDSWTRSQIFCLWIFVLSGDVLMDTSSHYTVHHSRVPFHQAADACLPGVLTTLATQQEVTAILAAVSRSGLPEGESAFWIGLKKDKDQCVVSSRPLRGFRWLDDSQDSQVSRWAKEPHGACTTVRCVTLQVRLNPVNRSSVAQWGLVPVSCRENSLHPFICKLTDQPTPAPKPVHPEPLEPDNPESGAAEPANPESTPGGPETAKPESRLEEPTEPESRPGEPVTTQPASRPTDPQTVGPELDRSGPDSGSQAGADPCQRPHIPRVRSLILDPGNGTRIHVECWTPIQLDLYCGGRPTAWRLADDSPANFSALCQPCEAGFRKDASGNCVDIDECDGAPCRHTCVNTAGSFRCVCADQDGKQHHEGSPECGGDGGGALTLNEGGVLIPVLVAVAALVLLVVVVMVTVKCCLMRRSKKRALEEEEETMAMRNKQNPDSFGTAHERRST